MDLAAAEMRALELDAQHDLGGAVAAYREILVQNPEQHHIRGALARLLMEMSRYGEAQTLCDEGLELEASAPVLASLSECYQAHFRATDAIALAQRAIELDIGCGYAWFALSAAYGLASEDQAADDAITDGLAVSPECPDLLVEYATRPALSPVQQVEELKKLTNRFPWHRGAFAAYAIALSSAGEEEDAREVRLSLLSRNPESHFTQAIHAMHLIMHGHHEEARPFTEVALGLWETSFYGLYAQFHLHLHDSELAQANLVLNQADILTQGTSLHATFVTQMMTSIDGPEGPRQLVESYVQQRPQSVGIRLAYAELHQLCGDPDAALMQVRIARRGAPERYDLIIAEARMLLEAGALDETTALLTPLGESAEIDALRTQVAAYRSEDPDTIRGLYEAHLERYPKLDFAWGTLFRDAIERADVDRITTLVSEPYRVPALPAQSALALSYASIGDFEKASQALERVLKAPRVAIHWVWSWEFALGATQHIELGLFRTRVRDAAREDGYLFEG